MNISIVKVQRKSYLNRTKNVDEGLIRRWY